jgi:ABC-type multidrug transport system ATPase subunit
VNPLLEFEAVSFCHADRGSRGRSVLRDVSFTVEAGEFCGVFGDRSGGKTTLARLAVGALVPDEGRILVAGHDLAKLAGGRDLRGLRAQIGFASRSGPQLTQLTAEEWIASSLATCMSWRDARARARRALDAVGVGKVAGETWLTLSDNEQMLVSIAHAMVRDPMLLVVDDPVAGLSPMRRAEIIELLRSFTVSGGSVLMTAADINELTGLSRIWSLDNGRLNGMPDRPSGTVIPLRGAGA